ncbi:MAG: tetratricopeptide repeat protein [Symploca sp. SIO2D2]|nr:tetratricopeptide repeat protein [Symploca sp. SIO2D2]
MDENLIQAYLELINKLLNCPNGEEAQILQANTELVDAGLVKVMAAVSEQIAEKGNGNAANWLKNFAAEIAQMLGMTASTTPQEYWQFLLEVLRTISKSNGNPKVVYPLLQANLDKLDDGLTQIVEVWAKQTLAEVEPQQAQSITVDLVNLGNLIQQFPLGNKASNLETAIACYHNALDIYTREAFPEDWAMTQNNLAAAYSNRIRGEKADNLEDAIACYQNALDIYTREAFPEDWAMTQNNLAVAYCDRIRGEKADNLEDAIACYQNALDIYTCEAFPVNWATTQNNLAAAYSNRIRGEKADNLENAIACYHNALEIYTREAFPVNWAMTQNNLALAYSDRIRGEKADNLENAIACYHNALEIYTREAFPVNWATTQNNLANAYSNRIRGEMADNLEHAIACFQNALEIRTREAFPVNWATTQNNLANAYSNRIRGEKADNLEDAIACFQNALEIYTREAFPVNWAMTQNNLAVAYKNRIRGEKADNLENAIACYQNALDIYTREAFPQNHIVTLFNLGLAYQNTQQWQSAYHTFSAAIDTVESLREEILSGDESKQKLAEEWNKLYCCMVDTCLQLKQPIEALEYAERSKNRNLVEQILLQDSHTIFPPEVNAKLALLSDEIAKDQQQIQQGKAKNYREVAKRLEELRSRRNQLQDQYLPVGSSFRFDPFQQTLDRETAVMEWYISSETFFVFIITNAASPTVWQSTPEDYDKLLDWANTYWQTYNQKPETWSNQLTEALENLAQILHIEDILKLLPASCNRLILIPHRFLHLFPLHTLPIANAHHSPTYLFDLFPGGVSYAPSCQLLQQLQTRQRPYFDRLFAIQTPTEDLYEKDFGAVGAIKQQFIQSESEILKERKATKSALLPVDDTTKTITQHEKLATAHCLLFFCHGYFNPVSPLDSGLQLADGNLTVAEIIAHFHLNNCRLVTLSACETGIPDFYNISDEYNSLPHSFLLAGSTNVVSTLWKVQSSTTALLMTKFYEELEQQNHITLALQTAQSWLRDTTIEGFQAWLSQSKLSLAWQVTLKEDFEEWKQEKGATAKPFNSPDYWSAFCVIGQGG